MRSRVYTVTVVELVPDDKTPDPLFLLELPEHITECLPNALVTLYFHRQDGSPERLISETSVSEDSVAVLLEPESDVVVDSKRTLR